MPRPPDNSIFLLLALAATGCSALFTYPAPRAEASSPFCGDGLDNDFDGRVDCADADCSDSEDCTRREEPADCRDEQDNDRDGYADRADPLCWHLFAGDPWQRCVSARSVGFTEGFDEPATARWFSNDANAPRVGPDPTGAADTVAELVAGPRAYSRSTIASLRGELRLTAAFRVPVGTEATLQLWTAEATPTAATARDSGLLATAGLRRTESGLEVTVTRGVATSGPVLVAEPPDAGSWVPLVVDVRCGRTIEARVGDTVASAGTGDCYALSTLPAYAPFGPLAAEELRVAVLASGGPAWLEDLAVEAMGAHTCEDPLPRLVTGPGALPPPESPRILSMAMSGDPDHLAGLAGDASCVAQEDPYLCALVLDRGTGRVEPWVSREHEGTRWPRLGMQFERGAPLDAGSVLDASVEWAWTGTCSEQRWRATVRTVSGLAEYVYESDDCVTWTRDSYVLADLGDDWDWHAYFVRAALGDQQIPPREEMYAARRGTTGLVFGRASRQRNVLQWTEVTTLNGDRPAAELGDMTFPITLGRVGAIDQVLVGHGPALGLVVHTIPAGIGEEVLAWQGGGLNAFEYTGTIDPSGLPGTTDRWDVESGAVVVARESDDNPYGLALYTADGEHRAPPGGHAASVGIACRQISRRSPPCEPPAQISGRTDGDGFCFRNETCVDTWGDCGLRCFDNPQDLATLASDRPATAHPTVDGAFTFAAAASPTRASMPLRAVPERRALHFDVLLDGDSDECAVRVGVGHGSPIPGGAPVGELAEIALEGDLVRFRPFTRARDEGVGTADDPSTTASVRGRWHHVVLFRFDEGLEVWSRELDVPSAWERRGVAPRGPSEASHLWIEIPGTSARCRGMVRDVVVDAGEPPPDVEP